jgi:tetratricopeptide (TPR) repeat protein
MAHVLISYSTKDSDYANRLANDLRQRGFDVWIDNAKLRSSENWWEGIVRALNTASAVIVLMSPHSRKSRWVQRELTLADNWGKPTYPLLLDGDNFEIFVLTQYADVTDGTLPTAQWYDRLTQDVSPTEGNGNIVTEKTFTIQDDALIQEALEAPPSDDDIDINDLPAGCAGFIAFLPPLIRNKVIPKTQLGLARAGLIALAIGTLLTYLFFVYNQLCDDPNLIRCVLEGPPPPASTEYVIVVSGFAFQEEDGKLTADQKADEVSLAVAAELDQEESLEDSIIISVDDSRFSLPYLGQPAQRITAQVDSERRATAIDIANTLNADIVIYGVVRKDETLFYTPEYTIQALQDNSADVNQFLSSDLIQSEIRITSPDSEAIQLDDFVKRIAIIRTFIDAMARYDTGTYADAVPLLQQAADLADDTPDAALFYVLMGNAAGRSLGESNTYTLDDALLFYQTALEIRPEYARALIGIGDVLQASLSLVSARQIDENYELPFNLNCLDFTLEDIDTLEDDIERTSTLSLLAIDCYTKATALSRDETDIDAIEVNVRASLQLGTAYSWRAQVTGNSVYSEFALASFEAGIALYETYESTIRNPVHESAGHLYGRYATLTLQANPDCDTRVSIANAFSRSFDRLDNNTTYTRFAEDNCEALTDVCSTNVSMCDS